MRKELLDAFRANAREAFYSALQEAAIREPVTVEQWARKYRRIGQGASPLSMHGDIPFDPDVMPWTIEPMNAATDPSVTHTVLWWASGTGKTDGVVTPIIGWCMAESPRNIMALYPNEAARDKWSRDVLQRTIDATPLLRSKVVEKKGRESGNTIAYKSFPGGSLYATAAGSPSNLRGPRVGLAYAGEIDAMPDSVGREGDPLTLLFKRCEGFEDSIKMLEGTGTIKGRSRVEAWYLRSDQRKWFVPCRKCGQTQVIYFRAIKWAKGRPESAEWECEACSALHNDRQRIEASRAGIWRPTAPFTGIRGYWLNAFVTTLPAEKGYKSKMHQWAAEWSNAVHSENPREAKRVFINTVLAETDEEEANFDSKTEWEPIFARRENYITSEKPIVCPEPVRVITAGIDVQANRAEMLVEGWGRDEQSWGIHHVIIYGEPNAPKLWDDLEQAVLRRYEHASGVKLEITVAFIDAGRWTEQVHAFTHRPALQGKIHAVKGENQPGMPVMSRKRKIGRGNTYFRIGTDAAKEYILGKLNLPMPEDAKSFPPGFRHYPMTFDAEFFRQLTVERAYVVYERGKQFRKYKPDPEKARNEGLDISVYSYAAFRWTEWDWDALEQSIATAPKEPQPKPTHHHDDDDGDDDFVGGWRR